jgi:hypothetical protein
MSDFLEEMDIGILQSNVIRRNIAIDALKTALKELKKGRKELNYVTVDPCHITTDDMVHDDYNCIIREITSLIKTMIGGNWCLSVNNTVEREKEIEDGTGEKDKDSDVR